MNAQPPCILSLLPVEAFTLHYTDLSQRCICNNYYPLMCLNSEGPSVTRFHGINQWWQVAPLDADTLLASSDFQFGMEVGAKMVHLL
jgi:hypothetical protein